MMMMMGLMSEGGGMRVRCRYARGRWAMALDLSVVGAVCAACNEGGGFDRLLSLLFR